MQLPNSLSNTASPKRTLEMSIYLMDLHFRVLRPISSLPFWHGARWSAWFREVCRSLPFSLDQFCLGICPDRHGQKPLRVNETCKVRLLAAADCIIFLPQFLLALGQCETRGEFSCASLELTSVRDCASGVAIWSQGRPTGENLNIFSDAPFASQIDRLGRLSKFTLEFTGPLRLPLPPGKRQTQKDLDKFCRPELLLLQDGISHLMAKIRCLETEDMAPFMASVHINMAESHLRWDDMRYNQQRRIALGGICGVIALCGPPAYPLARRLALGQYLGAGKNARFGLGYWRIPEINFPATI